MSEISSPVLPAEILGLICEFSVLSCLKPERRLHLSSNRCSSCGTNRQAFSCPSILLANSAFRDIGTKALYRNAFIVIQIDHMCNKEDPFDKLIGRASILGLITNIEFFIRRCVLLEIRLLREHDQDTLCRPLTPPPFMFSKLGPALPNLKKVGWTVGFWSRPLPWVPLHQSDGQSGQQMPPSCNSLAYFLNYDSFWTERITHFRLWLSQSATAELSCIVQRRTSLPSTAQDPDKVLSQLKAHTVIKPVLHLPNLEQLDMFLFTSRSGMSDLRSRANEYSWSCVPLIREPRPMFQRRARPAILPPGLMDLHERTEMTPILQSLSVLFQHIQKVNFWRIRHGHVVNNAYDKLDFAQYSVPNTASPKD